MPTLKNRKPLTSSKTIGVIDSGVGGLSILNNLINHYSNHNFVYVADAAHLPYGQKTPAYLMERATRITNYLQRQGITTIVVACHTLSSTVLPELQKLFPKVTYIDMVPPTIYKALEVTKNKRVGVMATTATIASSMHKKLLEKIDPKVMVYEQSCPLFVELIEKQAGIEELTNAIDLYLQPLLDSGVDTIILGCTHYPFIQDVLQKKAPTVTFVSAANNTLSGHISESFEPRATSVDFITSASSDYLTSAVRRYFKTQVTCTITYTSSHPF